MYCRDCILDLVELYKTEKCIFDGKFQAAFKFEGTISKDWQLLRDLDSNFSSQRNSKTQFELTKKIYDG